MKHDYRRGNEDLSLFNFTLLGVFTAKFYLIYHSLSLVVNEMMVQPFRLKSIKLNMKVTISQDLRVNGFEKVNHKIFSFSCRE